MAIRFAATTATLEGDASVEEAGELVNFVAQQVGGKGGGQADRAQAGGTDVAGLPAAMQSVAGFVEGKMA